MRYDLNDDRFLEYLSVYRTIPGVAEYLAESEHENREYRTRMLKQIRRLEKAGRVERIGSEKTGRNGTWRVVWRVIA